MTNDITHQWADVQPPTTYQWKETDLHNDEKGYFNCDIAQAEDTTKPSTTTSTCETHINMWNTSTCETHINMWNIYQHVKRLSTCETHINMWNTYQHVKHISTCETHINMWNAYQHVKHISTCETHISGLSKLITASQSILLSASRLEKPHTMQNIEAIFIATGLTGAIPSHSFLPTK